MGRRCDHVHQTRSRSARDIHYSDPGNPWYLECRTDELGNPTHYVRYPAGHPNAHMIQQINYPDLGSESFTYNSFGQVLTHLMTSGGTEEFTYDTRGLKQTYTPPATSSDLYPWQHPTVYTYYDGTEDGRLDRIDRLKSVKDSLLHTTTYDYNVRGQLTKTTHPIDPITGLTYSIINAYNDSDGQRSKVGTLASVTDELNHTTKYEYDDYKRPIKVIDASNKETTSDYSPPNGLGSLSHTTASIYHVTSPTNKVTESDYDKNFRRKRTTAAPNTPDAATTSFTYDEAGNLKTVTEPNHQADLKCTTYGYDDRNRQTSVTDALGHPTTTVYDDANNKRSVERADGYKVQFILYDEMNRLREQVDERDFHSTMVYDHAGNLTSQTDERFNVYSYAYDLLNRKTTMTYPSDELGNVFHEDYLYDWAGNLLTYRNRNGAIQTFTYDERNRQKGFTWSDGTSWQNTVYDPASRVKQITNAVSTINYTYYDDNRLKTEEASVASSVFQGSPARIVAYTYYDDGSRKTIQYPGGDSFTYAYTNRNQLWTITATGQSGAIVTYKYDLGGNIIRTDRENTTSTDQTPDDVNRVRSITHNLVGATKSFAYSYNRVNNITTVQRDGGQGDGYVYDQSRQITGFNQNGTVHPDPEAATVTSPASSTGFEFDGCGNRMSMSNSNTSLPSYTYAVNGLNQYTAMKLPGAPTPTPPPGQTPTPPPATPTPPPATPTPPPATATPPPATPTPPPAQQQVATPRFNPDGGTFFITQARPVTITTTTAGANIRYTLDGTAPSASNGTLIGGSSGTVSVTPSIDGRTLQAIAFKDGMSNSLVYSATFYYEHESGGANVDLANASSPIYDANGNLTNYNGWIYTYDGQNRLMTANNGTHTASFYYDGRNRQIARVIDNQVRFSVWDDWELIEEYASSSSRSAAYLQGARGVIRSQVNGAYFYYYQDSLGSTTHLANGAGQLLESYRYDLYGKPSYFNSTAQPLNSSTYNVVDLYAGERWVTELGLYDLRNRFMLPELGRFIQADPIGFKGDASNLYRYCHNDPADFSDPTGLDWAAEIDQFPVNFDKIDAVPMQAKGANGYTARTTFSAIATVDPGDGGYVLRYHDVKIRSQSYIRTHQRHSVDGNAWGPKREDRLTQADIKRTTGHEDRQKAIDHRIYDAWHNKGTFKGMIEDGKTYRSPGEAGNALKRNEGAAKEAFEGARQKEGTILQQQDGMQYNHFETSVPTAKDVDARYQATGVPSLGAEAVNHFNGRL